MSPSPDVAGERELDVVLWGATGFTGRLVAAFLLERHGAGGSLRWALGGRNLEKLGRVRDEIARATGVDAEALPLVTGDAEAPASLDELAGRTRVVCTTVGPYALYGSGLVRACARAGTHYCDLTGEISWMARMIEQHRDAARESGARIVHSCGFDCIPADLGTFFLQREMQARHGVPCSRVKYRVQGFRGGASGGTIASMLHMLEEAKRDPGVMRAMNDPYALNPKDLRSGPDRRETMAPRYDPEFGQWTAPFVMAAIDTKVVRRTNALLGYRYGRGFRYDEAVLTGDGPLGLAKAAALAAATAGGMAALSVDAVRRAVAPYLPAPGQGPSRDRRERGYWDVRLWGAHPDEPRFHLRARVTGDRDPGYGSTAKMLAESALCLAQDPLDSEPGFPTPAAAMGDRLIERLEAHAGVRFAILER